MKNLLKNLSFTLLLAISYFSNGLFSTNHGLFAQTLYGSTTFGGGTFPYASGGTIFKINPDGTNYVPLNNTNPNNTWGDWTGSKPKYTKPTFDGVNTLYGVTAGGGAYVIRGTIYKINIDGTGFTKLFDFDDRGGSPQGSLLLHNGVLYGTLKYGGNDGGAIFKINIDGTGYTILHTFTIPDNFVDGAYPHGDLTLDGTTLYGMTQLGGIKTFGTIFKIQIDGTGFTKLYDFPQNVMGVAFNGARPLGSLTLIGNELFGMTHEGGSATGVVSGTIFKITTDGSTFTKLLDFDSLNQGSRPHGDLVYDGTSLYGMTSLGGANNFGTIFKINLDGTGFTKLLDFDGTNNGRNPLGSLALSGTTLYGMTERGGAFTQGTAFKIETNGTGYTKLKDFISSDNNGIMPSGSFVVTGSTLYAMATNGGTSNYGTIFKMQTDGTSFTKLFDFQSSLYGSGGGTGTPILDGNIIYGVASGGDFGSGLVYKINKDGTNYTKLFDFNMNDFGVNGRLSSPTNSLVSDGTTLYGVTESNGITNGRGGIFKINTDGTGYTKLLDFTGTNGASPRGGLLLHNGVLYGMTREGGTNNLGIIFKINPDGSGYTKLLDFAGASNGSNPIRALIVSGNTLYGLARAGGANNMGTVFKINTDGTNFTKLLDFAGSSNGKNPMGSLTLIGNILFGTTSYGGANDRGVIFRINTDGTNYVKIKDFDSTDGEFPQGTLTLWGSILFGTTTYGGTSSLTIPSAVSGRGTLFKIEVNGCGFTKIKDFVGGYDGQYPTENLITNDTPPPSILTFACSLNPFLSCAGQIPPEQSYIIMGTNLVNDLQISAPTNFEISLTSGTGFGNAITLTPTSGSVPLTTIFVRQIAAAPNGASGTIMHSSTTATTKNVIIPAGTVTALPTITSVSTPNVSTTATSFNITYANTTGTPNQYSLTIVAPNQLPNFVTVTNATLTGTPITVSMPASADGTYNFELTVRNTVTGCVSAVVPFTLTVITIIPPTVTTPTHTSVNPYSAVLGGNVTAGSNITEVGIVWSATETNPTIADNKVVGSGLNNLGVFAIFVQLLPPATTINYRAYASNQDGVSYSTAASFTTWAALAANFDNGQNAEFVIGQPDFTTSSSGTTSQKMNIPVTIAIDLINNKMYVAESSNNRILRFAYPITANNPSAELVFGQTTFTSNTANQGGISQSSLSSPGYICVDNTGRLWVSDANNNRVLWFNNAYAIASNKPNADGILGQINFTTITSALTQNGMNYPTGITIDNLGNLYVADYNNNRVLRFDKAALKANGANANVVLGQANFTTNSFITLANTMRQPMGLVAQGSTLWVSDHLYNRILRFDNAANKANGANADGVLGQSNFTSSSINRGGSAAANTLRENVGLTTDFSGRLWVADRFNHRFLGYNNAQSKANGADADIVLGQPNFTTVSTATTQSKANLALGVFYDIVNNKLLAVDGANNRVLQFATASTSIGSTTPALGTGTGVDATVTLTGTGFTGTTAVSIGGQPARSFCVVNANTIKAVTNDNITNGDIVITNGGTATLNGFVADPVVPLNGTITGTNFVVAGGFTVLRVNIAPSGQFKQALRYREVGATTWNNLTFDGTATSADIQGVTANKAYEIYLQSYSVTGQWSNRSAITTSANSGTATFCSPTVAATAGIAGTTVTFNWTAQTGATRYLIRYWEVAAPQGTCAAEAVPGSSKTVLVDNGAANNVVVSGLKPNTNYYYDVQVYCGSATFTNRSNVIPFTTGAGVACTAPTVTVTPNTIGGYPALDVSWVGAIGGTSGSPKYQFRYKLTAGTTWNYLNLDATSYTLEGLAPSTQYDVQVAVYCEGTLSGEWSSIVTQTTGLGTVCNNVTLGASTPFSAGGGVVGANLVWTGDAITAGRRFFLGYKKVGETSTVWRWIYTNGVTVRSDEDFPNLLPSSNYTFDLQTYCNTTNFAGYAIGNPGTFTTGAATGADKATDSSVATNQSVANELVIYPNPSEGEVTIQTLQGFGNLARFELSVIDVLGREVYSHSFNGSVSVKLDGKTLRSGVYVAKVTENGKVMTKRFVIQ